MAISETTANQFRVEEDALGDVQVPADHLWGAHTQRSV
jgi:fumarate hydratase class II